MYLYTIKFHSITGAFNFFLFEFDCMCVEARLVHVWNNLGCSLFCVHTLTAMSIYQIKSIHTCAEISTNYIITCLVTLLWSSSTLIDICGIMYLNLSTSTKLLNPLQPVQLPSAVGNRVVSLQWHRYVPGRFSHRSLHGSGIPSHSLTSVIMTLYDIIIVPVCEVLFLLTVAIVVTQIISFNTTALIASYCIDTLMVTAGKSHLAFINI